MRKVYDLVVFILLFAMIAYEGYWLSRTNDKLQMVVACLVIGACLGKALIMIYKYRDMLVQKKGR
jgi:hypothetical protein